MQHTRQARRPDYPIEQIFYQRWSPRAFSDQPVSERDLLTALEAARWAPSSFNSQPWRFLYARNGDAWWQRYLDTLNAFNRVWAQRASALVFILSDNGDGRSDEAGGTASLDVGAAWSHLALQAHSMGLFCRGMVGFDADKMRQTLKVPPRYKAEMVVAIGHIGRTDDLPENLRGREMPSQRRPLDQTAFAGGFPDQSTAMPNASRSAG
ncbi:MAG: nitroreductase family protein [Tabrizicola sp.]|nr:nitroreductase family protein [Tabrizicola sp.]